MKNEDFKLPMYSEDLIRILNEWYPLKTPDINDSEREIFFKAGKREVVEVLLNLLQDKKEKIKKIEGFSDWESNKG